jgi:hypothetical protein
MVFFRPQNFSCRRSAEKDLQKIPKEILLHNVQQRENPAAEPVPLDACTPAGAGYLNRIWQGITA